MVDKKTCGDCPWKEEDGRVWRICKIRVETCDTLDSELECPARRAYRILRDEVRRLRGIVSDYRAAQYNLMNEREEYKQTDNELSDQIIDVAEKALLTADLKGIKVERVQMKQHKAQGIAWLISPTRPTYYTWLMLRVEAELSKP